MPLAEAREYLEVLHAIFAQVGRDSGVSTTAAMRTQRSER